MKSHLAISWQIGPSEWSAVSTVEWLAEDLWLTSKARPTIRLVEMPAHTWVWSVRTLELWSISFSGSPDGDILVSYSDHEGKAMNVELSAFTAINREVGRLLDEFKRLRNDRE